MARQKQADKAAELIAMMRAQEAQRGELTRSRYCWLRLHAEYGHSVEPFSEERIIGIIEDALDASPHNNVTIAFPRELVGDVQRMLDAQVA